MEKAIDLFDKTKSLFSFDTIQFILFMIMGSGANWVFPTALAQEIPYLENNSPEKLCIAAYMNAATGAGIIFMIIFVIYQHYIHEISHDYSVPTLLSISGIGCFLSAGVYSITTNNVSLLLYLCCIIGGAVGALSGVIMSPFLTFYTNDLISAARGGGSACIFLCAIIAFAQDPGSDDQRFSVSIYMILFGILLCFPIMAYYYIKRHNLGLRPTQLNDSVSITDKSSTNGDYLSEYNEQTSYQNPLTDNDTIKRQSESNHEGMKEELIDSNHAQQSSVQSFEIVASEIERSSIINPSKFNRILDKYLHLFTSYVVPNGTHDQYPWLRQAVPYMMIVSWVNFNTWGVATSLFPFAIANVSPGSGSDNLAIAYQVGALCLVLGDLSTIYFRLPLVIGICIFTTCCIILYIASISASGFSHSSAPILIVIFSVQRFIEAHTLTTTYRTVATQFPKMYREVASKWVGVADQTGTTIGAVAATTAVTLLFLCSASS